MKSLKNPAHAVAYLRVSKEEQNLGPEAQRNAIERWAEREGILVVAWHQDKLTSVTPPEKRPGLARALNDLKTRSAGWLVVAKRDRLARDRAVIVAIEAAVARHGARLASADGTPSGDEPTEVFQRQILDSVAQLERGFIRSRTKAALEVKRERGERIGTIPYGWELKRDGAHHTTSQGVRTCSEACAGCLRIVESPRERATIARARELQARGLTLRGIASFLDLEGFKTRKGTAFTHVQVMKMLGHESTPPTESPDVEERAITPTIDAAAQRQRALAALAKR
jgi:DNA invertase Pin-like site-specific DNA recombinase